MHIGRQFAKTKIQSIQQEEKRKKMILRYLQNEDKHLKNININIKTRSYQRQKKDMQKKLPRKRVLRCALIVERQKSRQLNIASKVGALSKSINLLRSRLNYWFLHHFFYVFDLNIKFFLYIIDYN